MLQVGIVLFRAVVHQAVVVLPIGQYAAVNAEVPIAFNLMPHLIAQAERVVLVQVIVETGRIVGVQPVALRILAHGQVPHGVGGHGMLVGL